MLRASRPGNVREPADHHWNAHELSWRFVVFALLMLVIGYATGSLHRAPGGWLALWAVLGWSAVMANRLLLVRALQLLERRGSLRDVVAIVGAGELADRVVQHFKQIKSSGLQIAGVFDDRLTRHQAVANRPRGTVQDLLEVGKIRRIDWVLIAIPAAAEERLGSLAHQLKSLATSIAICPQQFALNGPHYGWAYVGNCLPAALLVDRPLRGWGAVVKRLEDIVLASTLLLLSLPLFALIALAIWADSPGPIIFRQRRHGWNNRAFDVMKFRTMRWTPSASSALVQTARDDRRVSRLGRFLRRTSLDELPQLFNVLKGDMSLVGPRPHAIDMRTEDRLGHEIVGEYPHRHRVKPGMTGWAQVNGSRGATQTAEQIRRRVELDLYYAEQLVGAAGSEDPAEDAGMHHRRQERLLMRRALHRHADAQRLFASGRGTCGSSSCWSERDRRVRANCSAHPPGRGGSGTSTVGRGSNPSSSIAPLGVPGPRQCLSRPAACSW